MAPRRQAAVQQVPVGSLYGLPGYTERFEQYDNISSWVTNTALSAQTPFNPPSPFQKTDTIFWWEMETFVSWNVTYSAGTLALSPMAPYNIIQGPKLKLQGQYTPVECESGADMAFFQQYRPMRGKGQRNVQDLMDTYIANPGANSLYQQANLAGATLSQTLTSPYAVTNYPFNLEWPAGIYLDEYWELARNGQILPMPTNGRPAFVSPQYMSGGERNIQPQFNFAAQVAANYDQGPLAATAALTTSANGGNGNVSFRRVGVYSSDNPAEMPPIYGWQYRRASKRTTIGAVSKVDLPIPEYGQVLSVWAKIFDPSLGTNNVGGFYNVANITKCQLMKGSNLPRFDDDIPTMQNRFLEQHGFLPPVGTAVWDMAASRPSDPLTNATALNTLTNSNAHIHLELTAPGSSAYAIVGTELLVPVSAQ
jgi:hypothetical protein